MALCKKMRGIVHAFFGSSDFVHEMHIHLLSFHSLHYQLHFPCNKFHLPSFFFSFSAKRLFKIIFLPTQNAGFPLQFVTKQIKSWSSSSGVYTNTTKFSNKQNVDATKINKFLF